MKNIIVHIEGMVCEHCQRRIENALAQLDGIEAVTVSLDAGNAEIRGNPDVDTVIATINKLGYTASVES